MSIQSEIDRIKGNVTDSLSAIRGTGVNVPDGSNSNDLPNLINNLADTRQRVVDLGTLTFSTHGSYENSAQLTEEQMDEIFSSDDPPVVSLGFGIASSPIVYSFLVTYYDKESRMAAGKIDELTEGSGQLKNSVCEIFPSYDGSFDGPLLSMQTFSYFKGISEDGVLKASNQIKLPWDPTQPLEAATKQYVDNAEVNLSKAKGTLSIANGGTGVTSMTGTDYSANRPRGIVLQSSTPSSVPNGCIVGVYE